MKKLILTADDYGLTPEIDRGIWEAAQAGAISSITVMGNFSCASDLLAFHQAFPAITIGVHLNPIIGCPVLPGGFVSSLVSQDGHFLKDEFRVRFFKRKIVLSELEAELNAQVMAVQKLGIKISHLDSHQHEHLLPGYFEIFLRIAKKFGIPKVRNFYLFLCAECERPFLETIKFYCQHPRYWLSHWYGHFLMWRVKRAGLLMADRLISVGYSTDANQDEVWVWENLMKNLPQDGINELYCHPGYSSDWLRQNDSYADQREKEREIMCSAYFKELLLKNNVELVSFACLN